MTKDQKLEKLILIKNRQTGDIETRIDTKADYDNIYKQILEFNDVKQAIKIYCDLQGKTKKEFLQDFNLIEIINCFSTRYMAITVKGVEVEPYNTGVNNYGN